MGNPTNTITSNLSGWGRYPVVESRIHRPEKLSAFTGVLQQAHDEAVLARGAGRSYGDAALNPNGPTVVTQKLNRILKFDPAQGIVRCETGVTFQDLLDVFVPRGWFPKVAPGTKFPTMGGAVAFDVHGKNHYRDGAFSRHLHQVKLVLANGEAVQCSPSNHTDLFWATVGGMGLTGLITEVEFALRPIETAYITSHGIKARNLGEAMDVFQQYGDRYQYAAAWIDCLATGKSLGRSIITFGNHAQLTDLNPQQRNNPLSLKLKQPLRVPMDFPSQVLNPYTMQAFNTLYYNRQRQQEVKGVVDYNAYFYPLDALWDWNRIYGKQGFVQHQCVIPEEHSREAISQILQLSSKKGWGSFLAVLKRLGHQEGWLSFPMPGYTLALDIPVQKGLWTFLEQLDEIVMTYGGRVYLAKDARLSPQTFRRMYAQFPKWLAVKSQVDPHNRFASSLSQRLQIEPITP